MKPLVISFSGGRTSAMMTKYLLAKYTGKREILVIFANTGREHEETLQFVNNCDLHFKFNTVWIEAVQHHGKRKCAGYKVVTFETANRDGAPFEDMIKKYGIPNIDFPHCSRELKGNPVKSYIVDICKWLDYEIAIGYRFDEPKRYKKPKPKQVYPFVHEYPVTKLKVNQWWLKQAFDLDMSRFNSECRPFPEYMGNCDKCWKKAKRKLLTLILENRDNADWWNEMEMKYGEFIPEGQINGRSLPITFFRNNESMQDLIEDSKMPFVKATDTFTLAQLMHSAPELDFTDGCEESCEAF